MAVRLAVATLAAVALVLFASPRSDFFQPPSPQRRNPVAQAWTADVALPEVDLTRRGVLTAAAGAAGAALSAWPQAALADDRPDQYKLVKDYPQDAKAMLANMATATELTRGAPGFEQTVLNTRKQMNDFVAFYRRQPKITGKPSFSTLYTATNTLAGHYASYGNKYPVPEKRRIRLQQQFKEVDRALARGK
jgi:photosystem II Psb27 protein